MCLYSPRRCSCAPSVPRVQGMTEGKPSCPITRSYRTRRAPDTRGALVRLERAKAPAPARVNRSASERGPAPYCSGQGRGVGDMFRLAGEFLGQAHSLCGPLTCKDRGKPCCDVDLPSALIYSWITNSGGCTGELGNVGLLRIHTLRPARSSVLRLRCASGARSQAPQVR